MILRFAGLLVPEDSVSPSRISTFFTSVIVVRKSVILISGGETKWRFVETDESLNTQETLLEDLILFMHSDWPFQHFVAQ